MNNANIRLLLAIQNDAKSFENISPAKAFQKYDEGLNFVFVRKMEEPVDLINECVYRRDLMYGKAITKKQFDEDVKAKIKSISAIKDNPAAQAALCKLYLVALSHYYFNDKLNRAEARNTFKEIDSLLQQVQIETLDAKNLKRFINEIRNNNNL